MATAQLLGWQGKDFDGTFGLTPSVLLRWNEKNDKACVLLDCSENFQRFASSENISIVNLTDVLITSMEEEKLGGLAGMLMTAEMQRGISGKNDTNIDAECAQQNSSVRYSTFWERIPQDLLPPYKGGELLGYRRSCLSTKEEALPIRLWGPEGIMAWMRDLGSCCSSLTHLNLEIYELRLEEPTEAPMKRLERTTNYMGVTVRLDPKSCLPDIREATLRPNQVRPTVVILSDGASLSLFGMHFDNPGKLDPEKALKLGVAKGPDFAKLCAGQSVYSVVEGERLMVHSDQVLDGKTLGAQWVISSDPKGIMCDPTLLRSLVSKYQNAYPKGFGQAPEPSPENATVLQLQERTAMVPVGRIFCPLPERNSIRKEEPGFEPWHFQSEASATNELVPGAIFDMQTATVSRQGRCGWRVRSLPEAMDNEARLTFLGTASAMPGDKRNVTGILVRRPPLSLLFDCGEGSLSQIALSFLRNETYPEASLHSFLKHELDYLLISHTHADHHLGLPVLLQAMYGLGRRKPLLVYGPQLMNQLLAGYCGRFASCAALLKFQAIESLPAHLIGDVSTYKTDPLEDLTFTFAPNFHIRESDDGPSKGSFSQTVNFSSGPKIFFSGDCRPQLRINGALAKGSDIFIHEATFSDDEASMARDKNHSTVGQAVKVFRASQSKRLVLTHFSQRYSRDPPSMSETDKETLANEGVEPHFAYDHFSLPL